MDSSTIILYDRRVNPQRARWSASLHFLIDGTGFGIWAALLPSLKSRLELSDFQLGQALLCMVLGALAAMTQIGAINARRGSHRTLAVITPLYALALIPPILAPNLMALCAGAFLFGALKGALDVSVNTQAISVEKQLNRPINSSFQALWSAGGLLASLLTGSALKAGAPIWALVLLLSTALTATSLATSRALWPEATTSKTPRSLPSRQVLTVGALAFFALFSEGVMMDWGAVYARSVGHAPEWLAPIAFGVFCTTMALGRLVGDGLLTRLGTHSMLKFSGAAMTAGLTCMIFLQSWPTTFLGLGLAGLGMANLVPIFLRAGGRAHPESMSQGVANVSTIGYIGFLAGPPLIGALSQQVGLPGAFALVAVAALVIGVWGPRAVPE